MMAARRPLLSLKGRALKLLAQREHSRLELRRKLLRTEPESAEVERVLDELEAANFLSSQRFVESLVHRRAERFGSRRIAGELEQHGIDRSVSRETLAALQASEFDRARSLWQSRFGQPPADLNERARQHRFLLQRGFAADVVSRVIRQASAKL